MSIKARFLRGYYQGLAASWRKQLDRLEATAPPSPEFVAKWEARIADAERKAASIRMERGAR